MSSASQASQRTSRGSGRNGLPPNLLRESNRSSTANNTMSSSQSLKAETRGVKRRLDENDDEEEDDGPVTSSRRNLGPQRNGIESDEDVEDDDSDDESANHGMSNGRNGVMPTPSVGTQRLLPRSSDGYTPGSIVRVKLSNFITYTAVEFRPGPYLNMVIGPNGTGKSSIVCALALGLGWKPALLGRSKEVASYVKHGAKEATIELELKGQEGEDNLVLERKIFAADNRSEWQLNGRKAKANIIQEKIDAFNIDVANLCCFLPQDKVADFARMSPAELLKETQKAAGPKGMSEQHEKLIELGKHQRELGAKIAKEKAEIENLASRNEVLERDVRRVDERQQIVDAIEILNMRIPFEQYGEAKRQYDVAKAERNKCKSDLAELKRTLEPLNERQEDMVVRSREMERDLKNRHMVIGKDTSSIQRLHNRLDEQEKESQNLADKLSSVRKREIERKRNIADTTRLIKTLEEAVKNEPRRVDNNAFDTRIRTIKEEQRGLKDDDAQNDYEVEEIATEVKQLDREVDKVRKELSVIDSVKNSRLETLRHSDPDVATAVQFLRDNRNLFRQKVFEPVLLEISLNDPAFASAVEICVNYATLKTFVCQTREDYDTFTKVLVDERGLRLNVVELEGSNKKFPQDYAKPITDQEARRLGFDRFIIDCIKADDAIMQYLCESQNLHLIPYAQDPRGVNVEAIESNRMFKRYIVGNHMSTITYSTYGSKLAQTLTRDLRPARTLINTVDNSRKRSLENRMQEIGLRKKELEVKMQALQKKRTEVAKGYAQLREQLINVQREKDEAIAPIVFWQKEKIKLAGAQKTLAEEKAKPTADEEMRQITSEWAQVNGQSKEVVMKVMELMQQQVRLRSEADEAALRLLQYQEKLTALTLMKQDQESQFEEANVLFEQATRQCGTLKAEAVRLHKINQERVNVSTKELTQKFQQECDDSPNLTIGELQSRLAEKEAELEYMIAIRPGVREEYMERQRKIEELTSTMQKMSKDKEKKDEKVNRLHSQWYTALTALVQNVSERFARAFQAVGNAGQVRIAENPDYDLWGIEILVKFRDNEQLQLLTAHRQSGGERSISTITYLLSLTEMSRSPFSLVDEINQGMDQKYERQVHNHMVNVTCREEANQYFLITPKLLPNLTYHERMKILVVNNGEWIPGDGFDFGKYIRQRRAVIDTQSNGTHGR